MRTLQQLMDMRGRVALVTGGEGHIGRAIGESLAELGCGVALLDRDAESCEAAADALSEAHGVPTLGLALDLADPERRLEAPGVVTQALGRLDVLVNCAALVGTDALDGWAVPFEEQGLRSWTAAMDVNLSAAFTLTQACAPALRKGRVGAVINIASIYGVVGPQPELYSGTDMNLPAGYAASKGGLLQLTRYLASALAPEIRVNALSPGGVLRDQPEVFQERYTERTPLGRMANEEDLKGAAAFLASDLSAYVTGQNLLVDGGWTVR